MEPVAAGATPAVEMSKPLRVESLRSEVARGHDEGKASDDLSQFMSVDIISDREALDAAVLRTAIEDTVFGHIDPNVFVDAALSLVDLKVGEEPLETSKIDCLRYPIFGTPDGIKAELWVRSSSREEFATVRSYEIRCEPASDDYYLEGAIRSGMRANVTIWTGGDGAVRNLSIITQMDVAGKTVGLGLPLDHVPTGVMYAYDVEQPFSITGYQNGLTNGLPTSWTDSAIAIHGEGLSAHALKSLSVGMLSAH